MLPRRIILVDRDADLVAAWAEAFRDIDGVDVLRGDFFSVEAEAMVSPANSFGIMDGGLDRAIRDTLGTHIERRVRERIVNEHHGEIPVGSAEIVETDDPRWPLLVCAPTMRVPEDVSRTRNAYLAFRAALLAVRRFAQREGRPVASLLCPGLCTGVGLMAARRCAAQMRMALRQLKAGPDAPSFGEIHRLHQAMLSE